MPLIQNPSRPSFYYFFLKELRLEVHAYLLKNLHLHSKKLEVVLWWVDYRFWYHHYIFGRSAFKLVKKAFKNQINLPLADGDSTGLDLCFSLPSDTSEIGVPKLLFHLESADLDLPADNYMIADSTMGLMCLAMVGSNGMSIIGNDEQQNILVLHDLEKQTMSFLCSTLQHNNLKYFLYHL
ncbi:hypothetical protein AQUCO_00900865v1 [Aquilegia coerulea]|uniref:Peptidase A1 domain-containing protein n=1 Tax=Aquilegia coerulea TaxID=218851 RepID=A0A2G5EG77_AQUCA|nr:hypothetical protein AQUCO_00900865v1 [Aquilegia coerulea]